MTHCGEPTDRRLTAEGRGVTSTRTLPTPVCHPMDTAAVPIVVTDPDGRGVAFEGEDAGRPSRVTDSMG